MLGEGLTTGAAAQFLTYDESAVDRPRRRRWTVLGVLAAIVCVVAAILAA